MGLKAAFFAGWYSIHTVLRHRYCMVRIFVVVPHGRAFDVD